MITATAIIGFAGNALLSLCGVPLLLSSIRGTSFTSPWFLAAWMLGEVFAIWYGILVSAPRVIVVNYGVSILLIIGITAAQYGTRLRPFRK
jgi:hypothetical protein